MDPVTSSQFLSLKTSFARQGVDIEAALRPTGDIDYMYVVGRLLAVDREDNIERLQRAMPGMHLADADEQPEINGLVRLSIDDLTIGEGDPGSLTVPEVLDLIDEDNPRPAGEEPLVTPVHIVHITKICPAGEPELPGGATGPFPARAQPGGNGVKIGISDTGLQPDLNKYWWMTDVTGDKEPLGKKLPNNLRIIPRYAGHGTFVAGVAKCTAPGTKVFVNDHFTKSGGEAEDVIVQKLNQLIQNQSPDLVSLSAGLYTRNNSQSLPFNQLHQMHPNLTLVAAAGNDSINREFYPAAYPWAIGVGALAPGEQTRASFTNFGSWVNVYALGEGMINAYAYGQYTYQEPPRAPATQIFNGIAKWAGTSFSAPLVAGLIAREMTQSGSQAAAAAQAVLNKAQAQAITGVGPILRAP